MIDLSSHPLAIALSAAVPLRIAEYQRDGGPTDVDYERARGFGLTLGEKGDILLYRGSKKGETAKVFNDLANSIAVLAFCPGGIKVFGSHYIANPTSPVQPQEQQ